MSFEMDMQDLVAKAVSGRGNVLVLGSVTVHIHFGGEPVVPDPQGQVVDLDPKHLPVPPKGDNAAWRDAEAQAEKDEYELKAALAAKAEKDEYPEAPDAELVSATEVKSFRGTVGQQTLVDKAVKLGLKEAAGTRLWTLLDTSKELRAFCADHDVDFPALGSNNMFRRVDLKSLASLEGITRVKGFGTRSQAFKVLKAL
jgi:hypothetical protein